MRDGKVNPIRREGIVILDEKGRPGGLPFEVPSIPDEELIRTLVSLGQPRWAAQELKRAPHLRLAAMRLWADVQESARGDLEARQRVEFLREMWAQMRKEEILMDRTDVPDDYSLI